MQKINIALEVLLFIICFVGLPSSVLAASLEKAILLNEHGLTTDAKRELIDIIFEKHGKANDKAQAYYLLGNIAFEEDRVKAALDSWKQLVDKYPNSEEAELVRDRIAELSESIMGNAKESSDNAIARSYLRHADFWSEGKSNTFTIDVSGIPKVEAAMKWYDKVITEFPKSESSRIAYEGKLRTLFGWKESGPDGKYYGIKARSYIAAPPQANFRKYMPILLQTFEAFKKDHPNASTLQAFRYQIAQVYWRYQDYNPDSGNFAVKYPEAVKQWLNRIIIDKAGNNDSFVILQRGV